ncbi:transposase family protein [Streptomyces sp. NPDC059605]|uniref:transposase family protein n=1 Tax=unclassified Streptomyces TaxID=2593676 RepID=UPI0036B44889
MHRERGDHDEADALLGEEPADRSGRPSGTRRVAWYSRRKRKAVYDLFFGMEVMPATPSIRVRFTDDGTPALPGATHDLTAAREHSLIDALAEADLTCWADKAYQGAARNVRAPFKGRRPKRWRRRHNTTHAKIRCAGEQAMATLKSRRLLHKLRCSTTRITAIVKAVLALQLAAASG